MCPSCGTREVDWRDPVTRWDYDPPRFEAVAMRCPGCLEVERVREDVPDKEQGVRITIRPWEPPTSQDSHLH